MISMPTMRPTAPNARVAKRDVVPHRRPLTRNRRVLGALEREVCAVRKAEEVLP
jgi:hypothetical protein